MAYFPNSCAGEILDDQCSECPVSDDAMCPILYVQNTFNSEQLDSNGDETVASKIMNFLINEHGICQMKPIIENNLEIAEERQHD